MWSKASSQEISRHLRSPLSPARRSGRRIRWGEVTSSCMQGPFAQRVPLLKGCSGLPSILLIFPSATCTSVPQLLWQAPQRVGTMTSIRLSFLLSELLFRLLIMRLRNYFIKGSMPVDGEVVEAYIHPPAKLRGLPPSKEWRNCQSKYYLLLLIITTYY